MKSCNGYSYQLNPKGIILMKRIIFVFLLSSTFLALCNIAAAWELHLDFENGTNGALAQGNKAFTSAGGRTLFDSRIGAKNTSQSARLDWRQGDSGFTNCRGTVNFPSSLREGNEIWIRGYFYFKSPWDWNTSPVCKVLRIKMYDNSSDRNAGYHSIFFGDRGKIILSNEPSNVQTGTSSFLETDKWISLEMYVRFSRTSPIFRIWKDGQLVIEDRRTPTWTSGMSGAPFSYIMSYWNGGPGRNQTQYVDQFIYTNERPSNRDAHGNYMIGPNNNSNNNNNNNETSVPKSPQNLRVIENQ